MNCIKCSWKSIIILCCLIPVLIAGYYGIQKQGYFVDEIWSYGLANSKEYAHIYSPEGWDQHWMEPQYFKSYIEVDPGEEFSYESVFKNQEDDNHPPLFYLVLHTICSLFPGKFSKWFGIVPNLLYLFITNLFLYCLLKKLSFSKTEAVIGMLFYGLSAGAISCTIYIRMYMMMTMWMIILLNLYYDILYNKESRIKDFVRCTLITFAGYMTQYYFYIAVFFGACMLSLILIYERKMKQFFGFIVSNIGSLLLVLFCFPISFIKILGKDTDRGIQAYQNLSKHIDVLEKIRKFYWVLNDELFFSKLKYIIILLLAGMIMVIGYQYLKKKQTLYIREQLYMLIPICIFAGYFMVIALIAPFQVDRYIFVLYPIAAVMVLYMIQRLLHIILVPEKMIVFFLLLLVQLFSYGEMKKIQYIYPEEKENLQIVEKHQQDDCIYISDQRYLITADIIELINYNAVRKINSADLQSVREFLRPGKNEVIMYMDKELGEKKNIQSELERNVQIGEYRYLFETDKCYVYQVQIS